MKFLKVILIVNMFLMLLSGCTIQNFSKEDSPSDNSVFEEIPEKEMNGVFRYSNWGDSIEDVEKTEKIECFTKGDELLAYKDIELLTYNTNVVYYFDKNGLESACYKIIDTHTDESLYISDYENLDNSLQSKYGDPAICEEEWNNDLLKDTPGLALLVGDVKYVTIWRVEDVEVMHTLSSDNHKINHIIFYRNPNSEYKNDTSGL